VEGLDSEGVALLLEQKIVNADMKPRLFILVAQIREHCIPGSVLRCLCARTTDICGEEGEWVQQLTGKLQPRWDIRLKRVVRETLLAADREEGGKVEGE